MTPDEEAVIEEVQAMGGKMIVRDLAKAVSLPQDEVIAIVKTSKKLTLETFRTDGKPYANAGRFTVRIFGLLVEGE